MVGEMVVRSGFAAPALLVVLLAVFALVPVGSAVAGRIDELRAAAERGDLKAQVLLGKAYIAGEGVEQNDDEGVHWLRQAARGGDRVGQAWLGWAYERGRSVRKDPQRALTWYQRSARQGYEWAEQQVAKLQLQVSPPKQPDPGTAVPDVIRPVERSPQIDSAAADGASEPVTASSAEADLYAIEQSLRRWVVSARKLTLPSSLPLNQDAELHLEIPPPPELMDWAAQGVGLRINAELTLAGAQVEPLSVAAQALRPHHPAAWSWTVRALEGSAVTTKLELQARLTAPDNEPAVVDLGRVRRKLPVDGRFIDRVLSFAMDNWLAISLTLVVPLFLWLGMTVAGRSRKHA